MDEKETQKNEQENHAKDLIRKTGYDESFWDSRIEEMDKKTLSKLIDTLETLLEKRTIE